MDFIKENGVSVFLNVDVNDLAKRLYKAQGNNRPLLDKSQSEEVVIASIKKTFEERLSFYQQADIQVDGENHGKPIIVAIRPIPAGLKEYSTSYGELRVC
jgi:shikimate kinase